MLIETDTISGNYLSITESLPKMKASIRELGEEHYVSLMSDIDDELFIQIHDIRGMLHFSESISIRPQEMMEKKLPHFSSGMYIVSIRSRNGVMALHYLQ